MALWLIQPCVKANQNIVTNKVTLFVTMFLFAWTLNKQTPLQTNIVTDKATMLVCHRVCTFINNVTGKWLQLYYHELSEQT